MPPKKRTDAKIVANSGESRADFGTRTSAAEDGLSEKSWNATLNQSMFSTSTTNSAVCNMDMLSALRRLFIL